MKAKPKTKALAKSSELWVGKIETAPQCGACFYFLRDTEGDAGTCRRYPPLPVTIPRAEAGDTIGESRVAISVSPAKVWPPMLAAEWCGEFKAR